VPDVRLTLLSKPGCHLCDTAREVVDAVVADLGPEASVIVDEKSILDDAELLERYAEEIPVVLLNGKVHNIWRVDPARLKRAIAEVGA
jgi:glutaredoxin